MLGVALKMCCLWFYFLTHFHGHVIVVLHHVAWPAAIWFARSFSASTVSRLGVSVLAVAYCCSQGHIHRPVGFPMITNCTIKTIKKYNMDPNGTTMVSKREV